MDKEEYKLVSDKLEDLPVFMRYEWLNAIKGEWEWKVEVVVKGGEVFGVMPYFIKKSRGFIYVGNPTLVPYLGIYIRYPDDQKENRRLSFEKEIVTSLIEKLPDFDSYAIKIQLKTINLMPFHWAKFKLYSRFTYVIEHPGSREEILENVDQQIRRQVKKAEKNIIVEEGQQIDDLMKFKYLSYKSKNKALPLDKAYLQSIFNSSIEHQYGKLLVAKDEDNKVVAAILLVWDSEYVHYLIGASDPEDKGSGAMSLLMLEAVLFAGSKKLSFNFEGSMVPSVERYFRKFGGTQLPVYEVEKFNSVFLKFLKLFKNN